MMKRVRLPLRLRILAAVLFVVTAIVSVITFTMATMFHDDKSAYVTDMVSIAAMSAADEAHAVLRSYESRLLLAARVLRDRTATPAARQETLTEYFNDFPELIGVAVFADGKLVNSAIDSSKAGNAGVAATELAPLIERLPEGETGAPSGTVITNASLPGRLACMRMALPLRGEADAAPGQVVGLLHLNALIEIASRSSSFQVTLSDASGALLGARDATRIQGHSQSALAAMKGNARSDRTSAYTKQAKVDGTELIAGFAATGVGGVEAAASLPAASAYLASRDLLIRLMLVSLGLLVFAALGAALWARRIIGPVERLSAATGEVAKGQFDTHVAVESSDEIGQLAESFNAMAGELKARETALQSAQAQLVQSEKMAAFGLLGAGIAHEVKNPLAGILGCAQISLRQAPPGTPVRENLELIEKETKRCKTIIENLLRFARQEKTAFEPFDVNRPVADAAAIVHHQLELQKVKLEVALEEGLPLLRGNANQLQQVFMNLLINAQQAMGPQGGSVRVATRRRGADRVEIAVQDTGSGIPKEIQERIFDPFFTTKPNGKGTGLGLSVTYGIVKDHGGEIGVDSEPGKGTTFTIVLPTLDAALTHSGSEIVTV
jgi:signal transduction histidine kinase